MKPGGRVDALEGLRGHAAFLVFLVHAFGLLFAKLYGSDPQQHTLHGDTDLARIAVMLLFRSHYGVDLFFVLSGLLMADLALRRWPGTGRFLTRRALRIYPAYLASLAICLAAATLWLRRDTAFTDVAGNVFLLQGFFELGIPAINPPSWSLTYEAAFYLAVPMLALAWRGRLAPFGTAFFATLAVAFVAIVAGAFALPGAWSRFLAYFALFLPGIAMGVLDAEARARLAQRLPLAVVVVAWTLFAASVKFEWLSNREAAYYALSAACGGMLVRKACDAEGWLARTLTRAVPRWVGHHSYSFFLIHYIVLHLFAAVLDAWFGPERGTLYALVLVCGGLALSLFAARGLYAIAERFYFSGRDR
jgi:exopolysaccharide production protein ExoZ